MPYGDLAAQAVQRFATMEDLDLQQCTIEEREEYEPHIGKGTMVYAGVDYEKILRQAEKEADVILWDGGNNDTSFYVSDLEIVVVDPHRPGHELSYFPGEVNLRRADVIVINKVDTAEQRDVETVRQNIKLHNPKAVVFEMACRVSVPEPHLVKGQRVLVVEDGPTLTHGEMPYGAGVVAARQCGAAELVDPRPYAVGSIRGTYERFPHLTNLLPAMGYSDMQRHELEETIRAYSVRPGADCNADRPGARDQDRSSPICALLTKWKSSPSPAWPRCSPSSRASTSQLWRGAEDEG